MTCPCECGCEVDADCTCEEDGCPCNDLGTTDYLMAADLALIRNLGSKVDPEIETWEDEDGTDHYHDRDC